MRRLLGVTLAAGIALVAAPGAWAQGSETILVQDNAFVEEVEEAPAASFGFTWDWGAGTVNPHQVRQDDRLFRQPLPLTGGTYNVPGVSAGTFPYFCEQHGPAMSGVLKVRPTVSLLNPPGEPLTIDVEWALDDDTPTGDRFDVMYRIDDRPWRDWKRNTKKGSAIFGQGERPVEVKPGKTYAFRARSELERNPSRASKFSPPVAVALNP